MPRCGTARIGLWNPITGLPLLPALRDVTSLRYHYTISIILLLVYPHHLTDIIELSALLWQLCAASWGRGGMHRYNHTHRGRGIERGRRNRRVPMHTPSQVWAPHPLCGRRGAPCACDFLRPGRFGEIGIKSQAAGFSREKGQKVRGWGGACGT